MLHLKKVESVTALISPDGTLSISQRHQEVVLTPDQCKSLAAYIRGNIGAQQKAWANSELVTTAHEGFEG